MGTKIHRLPKYSSRFTDWNHTNFEIYRNLSKIDLRLNYQIASAMTKYSQHYLNKWARGTYNIGGNLQLTVEVWHCLPHRKIPVIVPLPDKNPRYDTLHICPINLAIVV